MLLPAIGPYEYFKLSASDFPDVLAPGAWVAPGITEALRSGAHQTSFEGLVTFPSYHAVTAVLFAYGWLGVPVIGAAFFALNLVMLISCVPIGSHYIIDVVVGIALAVAGLRISDRYFKATDRERPLRVGRTPKKAGALSRPWAHCPPSASWFAFTPGSTPRSCRA
jgi:membrane-associated phospholipid phosphatase